MLNLVVRILHYSDNYKQFHKLMNNNHLPQLLGAINRETATCSLNIIKLYIYTNSLNKLKYKMVCILTLCAAASTFNIFF